jgi:hypothetical protein
MENDKQTANIGTGRSEKTKSSSFFFLIFMAEIPLELWNDDFSQLLYSILYMFIRYMHAFVKQAIPPTSSLCIVTDV